MYTSNDSDTLELNCIFSILQMFCIIYSFRRFFQHLTPGQSISNISAKGQSHILFDSLKYGAPSANKFTHTQKTF